MLRSLGIFSLTKPYVRPIAHFHAKYPSSIYKYTYILQNFSRSYSDVRKTLRNSTIQKLLRPEVKVKQKAFK